MTYILYIPWNFLPIFYILYSHHEAFKKFKSIKKDNSIQIEIERQAMMINDNAAAGYGYLGKDHSNELKVHEIMEGSNSRTVSALLDEREMEERQKQYSMLGLKQTTSQTSFLLNNNQMNKSTSNVPNIVGNQNWKIGQDRRSNQFSS